MRPFHVSAPAALALALFSPALHAQGPAVTDKSTATDKYAWLEEVSSDRALNWVRAENERSLKVLEADPHYQPLFQDALKIAEDPSRLPMPGIQGDEIYNFWQDAQHIHGILRKTTLAEYNNTAAQPNWHTVLDVDALGKKDGVAWVYKGMDCLYPGDQYCLVQLSAGGEDAVTLREFDLKKEAFVPGGFVSDHSKTHVSWKDKDTLLIARDWGAGTLTSSSYPYIVKEWKRGTPITDAKEVFRGDAKEMDAGAFTMNDAQGDALTIFDRTYSFFENGYFVATPKGMVKLGLPAKANPAGLLAGRMLAEVRQDWTPAGGPAIKQGSLVEFKLADVKRDPEHLHPTVVFAPTADEFLGSVETTRSTLLLTTLKHVQGRAYVYSPTAHGWSHASIPVQDNATVHIISTDNFTDRFYLGITGFLEPLSLYLGNAAQPTARLLASRKGPEQFDASNDTVEQLEVASKDGTMVPYFVVHRKDIKYDGTNPTLLNAYGGFELSETPNYSATIGKLWLEHGGVFVLANIRGGGEFGPAWHEAGLKTHRQRIYDDFAAVGQDLITRKITSPKHLGILGGSNGGLLMGVEFEQHPDMWNAVVIQVPLLDMLGFEHIAAGASWVGEYGSVSNPEERAFLAKISPYNNLKQGVKYPEPLIFTTTKDDRVGPQHARKFAALMEEYKLPFYYDEIIEGGHAAGANLKEQASTWAVTYTYLAKKLMN